jgi:ring-1,2-phenylacetyl-CoA epoxidase subunit PaaD
VVTSAPPALADIRARLQTVHDPEIPTVSIADLGLVHDVRIDGDDLTVELLPTFVACPALDVIRSATEQALAGTARRVKVAFTYAEPWTTERLTDAGRDGLRAAGIAPPAEPGAVRCPFCSSGDVAMDSAFGPALCRSLYYCRGCRQPFEAFKPI